jgi:uncharacterized lipoprotein YajG
MWRRTIKAVLLLLVAIYLAGCSAAVSHPATPTLVKPRAVYLVIGQGQVAAADLRQHPEVVIVHTFGDLQALATATDISLWIDKNAARLADSAWLMQAPQNLNPLVLVGDNQAL